MRIFQAMGALASSDSGASIQNKLGIAAPSLTPEELLHQQKVCWLFLIFKKISSINKSKLPPKLFLENFMSGGSQCVKPHRNFTLGITPKF